MHENIFHEVIELHFGCLIRFEEREKDCIFFLSSVEIKMFLRELIAFMIITMLVQG